MQKSLIFLSLFFALSSTTLAVGSYPDVPADHKNYEAIEFLDERQVINGYQDGTFGPDNLVTRAEALKILVGAFAIAHDGNYEAKFSDVSTTDWFFSFVMAAEAKTIVKGYDDGKFRPNNNVNLAETLKMMVLSSDVKLPSEVTGAVFIDVPKTAWYSAHALYARDHNILLSDDYGYVHPDQAMTRAAFAELIYRLIIVKESGEKVFPIEKNWPYYESETLPFKVKYDDENWQVIKHSDEVVFMRPDKEFLQFSHTRIYPNSGVVTMTVDLNTQKLSKDQYFANVKSAFSGATFTTFSLKGLNALEVLYPEKRIVDWYVYLNDGRVLVAYTEFGSGGLGFQLQQVIKAMLSTLEYKEVDINATDYSEILSAILKKVLVEGAGTGALNTLPDKIVIETDAIGVGTGPVDYYYSSELDYTFKFERSLDVILDTRKGKTSSF